MYLWADVYQHNTCLSNLCQILEHALLLQLRWRYNSSTISRVGPIIEVMLCFLMIGWQVSIRLEYFFHFALTCPSWVDRDASRKHVRFIRKEEGNCLTKGFAENGAHERAGRMYNRTSSTPLNKLNTKTVERIYARTCWPLATST